MGLASFNQKRVLLLEKTHSKHELNSGNCKISEEPLQQQQKQEHPETAAYGGLLKACATRKDLEEGKRIHARIVENGYPQSRYLWNLLIEMYGKCGSLDDARWTFDDLDEPNVFSWTLLVAAYARKGCLQEARLLFENMPERNAVSWNALIAAYAKKGALQEARDLLDKMPDPDVTSFNTLLSAYAQNGQLREAKHLFDSMSRRDVVTYTAMIEAYVRSGDLVEARRMFTQMPQRDPVAWTVMVKAYAESGHLEEARKYFDKMPQKDTGAWTAMISAYAQKGDIAEARRLFDQMPQQNMVSRTSLISAYARKGYLQEARSLFDGLSQRDAVSWVVMITAYAQQGDVQGARRLFDGIPRKELLSWNAMLTAYTKNGHLEEARSLFDEMPQRDVVSWTAMIKAYGEHSRGKEAIRLFHRMESEGVQPDDRNFISMLNICANLSSLLQGRAVHRRIRRSRFQKEAKVLNALVHMYAKCGSLVEAKEAFDEIGRPDVVSWNAMVAAYAQDGHVDEALGLVPVMNLQGAQPNEVTFVLILSACSHASLLEDGLENFMSISGDHGLVPTLEHYGCMVDLLGRAKRLDEAEELINAMPYKPGVLVWRSLLNACAMHGGNAERAANAAKRILEFEPEDSKTRLLLLNAYVASNSEEDAEKARKILMSTDNAAR